MNVDDAKKEVAAFFQNYGVNVDPSKVTSGKGKAYELYCLAKTIEYLKSIPGVSVRFVGTSIDFKNSPGKIDKSKSYFVVSGNGRALELHSDIEVMTLSAAYGRGVTGRSAYHEIDLVLAFAPQDGQRPSHNQIVLGVECKAHANFKKEIIRQVLGVRRELSFYTRKPKLSRLAALGEPGGVSADPASEYWLAHVDPKGTRYRAGPEVFGIKFKHWCP